MIQSDRIRRAYTWYLFQYTIKKSLEYALLATTITEKTVPLHRINRTGGGTSIINNPNQNTEECGQRTQQITWTEQRLPIWNTRQETPICDP